MRAIGLGALGLVVFLVSAVVLHIGLLLFAAGVLSGSCGEGCYTDVYLGPGVMLVDLVVAIALATFTVRRVARRTRRGSADGAAS